jgi:CHAT domain-containing protein
LTVRHSINAILAGSLALRYRLTPHREADLDRALEIFRDLDIEAVDRDGSGYSSFARAALVDGLMDRYERHGEPKDMQVAQQLRDEAPTTPDPGVIGHASGWDPAALRDFMAFRQSGDPQYLDRAIEAQEHAREATGTTEPEQALIGYVLGVCYLTRHLLYRQRRMADLDRAITLLRDARRGWTDGLMATGSAVLLGRCLILRYTSRGNPADIREARTTVEGALAGKDVETRVRAMLLILAAHCDAIRAERDGDELALDRSMDRFEEAGRLLPEGSMEAAAMQSTLAGGLQAKAESTRRAEDVQRAYRASRAVCGYAAASPLMIQPCAEGWGHLAWRREDDAEAAEGYVHAVRALQAIAMLYPRREDRQDWLGRAGRLAARAAFALARRGQPGEAVVVLETGRAVLLSESLDRQRADLTRLAAAGRGDLRDRYERAAARAARAVRMSEPDYESEFTPVVDPTDPGSLLREMASEVVDAREDLRRAVEEIRRVDGFETFLLPPSFADLQAIVRAGPEPLVYLAATPRGGLALLLSASRQTPVEVVWLPELTVSAERTWVTRCIRAAEADDGPGYDQAARWLGEAVMAPVTALLAPYRRAVLIPDGLLGSVPLHAATLPAGAAPTRPGHRHAFDALTLIYAPSARAFAAARAAATSWSTGNRLLAVADPAPVAAAPLPGAQVETDLVAAHFGTDARILRAGEATRKQVLSSLAEADVHHFACHGVAEPADPLNSLLLMAHDERLTLRDIYGLELVRLRLAVLSACQSAVVGDDLPDEVVSLATGVLQAGAGGVVATLWSVDDVSTAALMARFYQLWRTSGVEPAEALRRAQLWVRSTTNGQKLRALPELVRIPGYAPAPDAAPAVRDAWESRRSHEHPLFWAAFVFLGR